MRSTICENRLARSRHLSASAGSCHHSLKKCRHFSRSPRITNLEQGRKALQECSWDSTQQLGLGARSVGKTPCSVGAATIREIRHRTLLAAVLSFLLWMNVSHGGIIPAIPCCVSQLIRQVAGIIMTCTIFFCVEFFNWCNC